MPDFSAVQNYGDIDFVDTSVEDLLKTAIDTYESEYYSLTGNEVTLEPGDDAYILLYTRALIDYSMLQSINNAARMNFLKYASGDYLDNLAANVGLTRTAAEPAVTTVQFSLGTAQSTIVDIPQGTRVTPGNGLYFATDEDLQIAIGSLTGTVTATCTADGSTGNGYVAGQINTLVDAIAYITAVSNTETTQGGSDEETDAALAQRIFSSMEGYSVAGPTGAYDYFAKSVSSDIADTYISSPSAGTVNIRVLLENGELPGQALLNKVSEYLSDTERRPLTDSVTVAAPDTVSYDITLTYYIDPDDAANDESIKTAVEAAVESYETWQRSKIGRDILPDKLTAMLISAGARRLVMTSPVYTQVAASSIAIPGTVTVTYGGIDSV